MDKQNDKTNKLHLMYSELSSAFNFPRNFLHFLSFLQEKSHNFVYSTLGCSLGVASITNIHNNSLDNERLQEQSRGLNIFNNTSVLPSMGKKSHFDLTLTSGNVSVLSGNSAFLVCSVVHMGKNVISWIRYNDMNLLSVGKLKNTQDFRISTLQSNSTWTLKVNFFLITPSVFLRYNLSLFFVHPMSD